MKTFKTSKAELLFLDLPKDAMSVNIPDYKKAYMKFHALAYRIGARANFIEIPVGYALISKLSETTENVAKELVDEIFEGRYKNYANDYPVWFHYATDSLNSIAHHLGLNLENNIYLLKKL